MRASAKAVARMRAGASSTAYSVHNHCSSAAKAPSGVAAALGSLGSGSSSPTAAISAGEGSGCAASCRCSAAAASAPPIRASVRATATRACASAASIGGLASRCNSRSIASALALASGQASPLHDGIAATWLAGDGDGAVAAAGSAWPGVAPPPQAHSPSHAIHVRVRPATTVFTVHPG
ncbi:MAG: hypothetical protein U0168_16765 [Nannocystaceae bacterium]